MVALGLMPTSIRRCQHCRAEKPLEEFKGNKRGKDGHENTCRVCHRDYVRHKRQENKLYIDALKDKPCADCGQRFPPVCMDFDHVRGEKQLSVAYLTRTVVSKAAIEKEISKCELVCSNCHRLRTQVRRQGWQKKADTW